MAKRSQSWKDHERTVAKKLKGKRILRGADFSESAPDVEHHEWSIECKYRKTLPKLMTEGLKQAKEYAPQKTPILVCKEKGKKGAIVSMYLDDFINWLGHV